MTKRSTLQQRARELQRAERAQGLHTSYHDALNRVRTAAEAQPADPVSLLLVGAYRTARQEAELALSNELIECRNSLMRTHSKARLVTIVRRPGRWFSTAPETWTKQELANDIVLDEDGDERYAAYGRVGLFNGEPRPGDRPHCGGVGCVGHAGVTPWPQTRARFRAKAPCIGAGTEFGVRALPADAAAAERARAESLWVPVAPDQPCPCSGPCRHGQACPDETPDRTFIYVHQHGGRLAHVERIGGLLPDVHAWADGYECTECQEGTRQAVTLLGLPWGETVPGGALRPFDGIPHRPVPAQDGPRADLEPQSDLA